MEPTLCLLYINDLADTFVNLKCVVKLYTDDAKLYCSYKFSGHSPVLIKDIEQLVERAKTWKLRIANSKCIAHRLSTRPIATLSVVNML